MPNDTGRQLSVFQRYFHSLPEMAETGVWDVQVDSNTRIIWKIEEPVCFLNMSQALKSEHVYTSSDRITYDAYHLGLC